MDPIILVIPDHEYHSYAVQDATTVYASILHTRLPKLTTQYYSIDEYYRIPYGCAFIISVKDN